MKCCLGRSPVCSSGLFQPMSCRVCENRQQDKSAPSPSHPHQPDMRSSLPLSHFSGSPPPRSFQLGSITHPRARQNNVLLSTLFAKKPAKKCAALNRGAGTPFTATTGGARNPSERNLSGVTRHSRESLCLVPLHASFCNNPPVTLVRLTV